MSRTMHGILMLLSARLPGRVYEDNGTPFLERYFLGFLFGTTIYLHRFVASDPDRGLHDHPWGWAFSLVLCGRYVELRRNGELRNVGWFNALSGNTFHRVLLPRDSIADEQQQCWTLFVHGPKRKAWGFLRPLTGWNGAHIYKPHRDRDGDSESAAWAIWAPKGRELEGRAP